MDIQAVHQCQRFFLQRLKIHQAALFWIPSHIDVLHDGHVRELYQLLMDRADSQVMGYVWVFNIYLLIFQENLTFGRFNHAGEYFHQR